jgi:hypothetical protein
LSEEDDWDVDNSVPAEAGGSTVFDELPHPVTSRTVEPPHKPFSEMADEELRQWVADNWRASDYLEGCRAYAERRRVKEE